MCPDQDDLNPAAVLVGSRRSFICGECYSDGEIVVEDSATSSLVSSSFFGYEVDSGEEKAIADMSASSSVVHASSQALGAMYSSPNNSN